MMFADRVRCPLSALLVCSAVVTSSFASDASAARPVPVAANRVTIDDAFWSPKLKTWRAVTIKDCLDKFERDGAFRNFDHVARDELDAPHGGPQWYDGLIYELIRGAGDLMAQEPDPVLEARIDGYIDRIGAAAARDSDGYINTYTQMREPGHRWGQNGGNDREQHDLYNIGCLVEAGIHYYRATGKTKLLATAVRAANGMVAVMGPPPRKNIIPGHALSEESFVRLYELFRERPELKRDLGVRVNERGYLDLARFWIDARGHHEGRQDFGEYGQDHLPVLQQATIEGHAVRATLLAAGVAAYGVAGRSPGTSKRPSASGGTWSPAAFTSPAALARSRETRSSAATSSCRTTVTSRRAPPSRADSSTTTCSSPRPTPRRSTSWNARSTTARSPASR